MPLQIEDSTRTKQASTTCSLCYFQPSLLLSVTMYRPLLFPNRFCILYYLLPEIGMELNYPSSWLSLLVFRIINKTQLIFPSNKILCCCDIYFVLLLNKNHLPPFKYCLILVTSDFEMCFLRFSFNVLNGAFLSIASAPSGRSFLFSVED